MWAKIKDWISLTADVLEIGAVLIGVGVVGVAAAIWLGDVPSWTLAVSGALAVVFLVLWLRSRRRAGQAVPTEDGALSEALEGATTYLATIDDVIGQLALLVAADAAEDRAGEFTRLRDLVFTLIFQGVHSAKGEQVRCVYLEPVDHDNARFLKAKHWQGHSSRVQEMRLHCDPRSVAGASFTERTAIYVPSSSDDPRMQTTNGGKVIGAILCVPVEQGKGAGEPRGVLSVSSSRVNAFSTSDQEFISVCASVIALIEFASPVDPEDERS